jgi:hypothetical protein
VNAEEMHSGEQRKAFGERRLQSDSGSSQNSLEASENRSAVPAVSTCLTFSHRSPSRGTVMGARHDPRYRYRFQKA